MDKYRNQKNWVLQKEFSGLGKLVERNIRFYINREDKNSGVVSIENLKANGQEASPTQYIEGSAAEMEGEYDRQIVVWQRKDIGDLIEDARAAGHYEGLE